ncbi:MAG TPA: PD-(D/E)XK nuclease family protein, partial [Pirellulales bacterium]|nr:PD-(D/E)XK nuclease family protein [Pirellulales bacterium]
LERFVVENDDLLALEARIGRFNIFDALGIKDAEIRHSNFLAFILDPAESHGQGQLFLNALLMDLLKAAPSELRPLSPIELDGTELRGVEVRREWEHIDLLITCEDPLFAVVVENKVESHEHSNQLSRYHATMSEHFVGVKSLYVYLTATADSPSEEDWVPYSYADIHRVFERVRATYKNAIGDDVRVFLDHYLGLIGNRFMDNVEIDSLCRKIYKNHRQALKLIFERVGSPASAVIAEAETVLREDGRWTVFYRQSNLIDFVPTTWLEWLPPLGLDFKSDPRSWFVFRIELYEGKLDYYVLVGRMSDTAKRKEVVELLIAEGSKFGFKHSGQKVKNNYTRVSGRERILRWNEGCEPASDAIRAGVKNTLDGAYPKLNGIPALLRPLFGA